MRCSWCSRALLALALCLVAAPTAAQQCAGIPSGGHGFLTYGFEGTDGATGDGISFAYRTSHGALLVQRRSLDGFTLVDDLGSVEAQTSFRVPTARLPLCLVAGVNWTAYDNEREESRSWTAGDPGYVIERHRIGGPYHRLQIPVGVGIGEEFQLGAVSLTPFFAPALVYETETYRPEDAAEQERRDWGWGAKGGVAATVGWLVVRTTVSHTATHEYALSSQHNFPMLSLHVGVGF